MTTSDTTTPTTEPAPTAFTEQQISEALNRAADDILNAVNADDDEGLRDAMNLVVNTTMAYLSGQAHDLQEAVEHNYDDDYETVLGWIEEAI